MPFVHVKNLEADLLVPYPSLHTPQATLAALVSMRSIAVELEPGYTGDITPPYWKDLGNDSRFEIEVSPTGQQERALIRSIPGSLTLRHSLPPVIPGIEDPFDPFNLPEEGYVDVNMPIGSLSHIDASATFAHIGGMVVFANPDATQFLTQELFRPDRF